MKLELSSIRAQNLNSIFTVIHREGPTTRAHLAQETGLSLMTVSNVVDVMINNEIVKVCSKKASMGAGRKAELVGLNTGAHAFLILDLTNHDFGHVVLGINGRIILDAEPIPTETNLPYEESFKHYLAAVRKELEEAGLYDLLTGVAVSVPGPYQPATDTVFTTLAPELTTMRLMETVRAYFPDVVYDVNEDVKYAAKANLSTLENAAEKTLVYIYLGEGVGGAIISNGHVLMGACSMAGEMGRMVIGPDMRRASELNRGNFLAKLGIASDGDWVNQLMHLKNTEPEKLQAVLDATMNDLVELCYSLTWLIDPHRIILECDHIRMVDENFDARLQQLLAERLQGVAPTHPRIVMTRHGLRYAYRGAAISLVYSYLLAIATDHSPSEEE